MRTTLLLPLLLLPGCFTMTMGRNYDPATLDELRAKSATKAEILASLGEPQTRSKSADGSEIWMYMYTESTAAVHPASFVVPFYTRVDSDMKSKTTMIHFDKDGRMADWTIGPLGAVPLGTIGSYGNEKITEEAVLARIEKGKSTKDFVRGLLGDPNAVDLDAEGSEKWIYVRSEAALDASGAASVETANLTVLFDESGVVKSYARTNE